MAEFDLERFLAAQQNTYTGALSEIKSGRKKGHWMWFIFPQYKGLGHSNMSRKFAIKSMEEATAYLSHPILGARLIEISNAVLRLETTDPLKIMGSPDDLKLLSSMTLFSGVTGADSVFDQVINKFYGTQKDNTTLRILSGE